MLRLQGRLSAGSRGLAEERACFVTAAHMEIGPALPDPQTGRPELVASPERRFMRSSRCTQNTANGRRLM